MLKYVIIYTVLNRQSSLKTAHFKEIVMSKNQETIGVTSTEILSALPMLVFLVIGIALEVTTGNKEAVQTLGSLAALFSIPAIFVWGYGLIRNIRKDYFSSSHS